MSSARAKDERIILKEEGSWLTSDKLVIKGDEFNLDQIEEAWVETGFAKLNLVVRLTSGEEIEFKSNFITLSTSMSLGRFSAYSAMAVRSYVQSRLDLWASTINTQIEYLKLKNQKTETITALKCSRCGANLGADLKCSHCGLQHITS